MTQSTLFSENQVPKSKNRNLELAGKIVDLSTEGGRIETFFRFLFERQSIFHKRFILKQLAPWTKNPILCQYKFTNCYREEDAGTQYLIDRVYKTCGDSPNALFNTIAYRFFNTRNFFDIACGSNNVLDYKNFVEELPKIIVRFDEAKKQGKTIFSDAYMTCGIPFDPNYRPESKHVQYLLTLKSAVPYIEELYNEIKSANDPESVMKTLLRIRYLSRFIAYEVWTDLSYIKMHKWSDNDFVNTGPGALWGIAIIKGIEKNTIDNKKCIEFMTFLRDNQKQLFEKYNLPWQEVANKEAYSNVPFLSLRNVEHSLCETRKFLRIVDMLNGGERCKIRRYP